MKFLHSVIAIVATCHLGLLATAAPVDAGSVTQFESGTVLRAADLNATISALVSAVNDNAAKIAEMEAAAAAPLDLADRQYCLSVLSSGVFVSDDAAPNTAENPNVEHIGVGVGIFKAGVTFHAGGTMTLTAYEDIIKEAFPDSQIINGGDELGQESGTWTLNGNVLAIVLGGDNDSFAVSKAGDVIIGAFYYADDASDGSGIWHNADGAVMVEVADASTCSSI